MTPAHASSSFTRHRKTTLWRCFWALVLLLHAPVTWHVIRGDHPTAWSSIVLLVLATAFFLMEVCLARCVGLINDRRSAMVFLLIIALLHVGVLERGFPVLAEIASHGSSLLFTFLGTLALTSLLALHVVKFRTRCGNLRSYPDLRSYLTRCFPALILAPQVRAQPFANHRGPPLHR
jgi:hypothetical protein